MNVFFNTQTQAPRCCLQITGEMILTPARFWLGGKTIQEVIIPVQFSGADGSSYAIIKECHQVDDLALIASRRDYWERPWVKRVMPAVIKIAMAILFLPSLLIGSVLKLVSLGNCIFPCMLKPVIVQQYKYHTLVDADPAKFPALSTVVQTATERTYCSYEGKVVELIQVRQLIKTSSSETKVVHCKDDIAIDDGYNCSTHAFHFKQDYVLNNLVKHVDRKIIPCSIQTMSPGLWSCWNPNPTVAV